jgi:uncharacterized protein (TIGR02453 family)
MSRRAYFTADLFRFLRELKRHNDRAWFQAHKQRYEECVRDPMLRFIADVGPRLAKISAHFVADPRPVGGSLFRIHRDTRFAADKSPYKTHVAAAFRHEARGETSQPGFYVHLDPGECFVGAGLWHPDPAALAEIRDAIVAAPVQWKRATARLELGGEALKRPPRGYDPDHPLIEDLKRKDFTTGVAFTEKQACAPGFLDAVAAEYRRAAPLVAFLCRPLGLQF